MPLPDGDMGGVNGEGDMTESDEGEPGKRLIAAAKSMADAPEVLERGEGTAEPVETYNGLSSSVVWAKKHTLLAQLVPSLQSRVRY
jgi:hypothetical protein